MTSEVARSTSCTSAVNRAADSVNSRPGAIGDMAPYEFWVRVRRRSDQDFGALLRERDDLVVLEAPTRSIN